MKRRSFLAGLLAAPAAPVLAPLAAPAVAEVTLAYAPAAASTTVSALEMSELIAMGNLMLDYQIKTGKIFNKAALAERAAEALLA